MGPDTVAWVKQGSSRFWPCVTRDLESVSEEGLRRELANQIRRVQAKHPERCATGPAPNMVLVEFLGSHDFAWAQIHKIERYRGQKDAPDGPTVSADEYHEAVNRLTGCAAAAACRLPAAAPVDPAAARLCRYTGAVREAEEHCRAQREAAGKPQKKARPRPGPGERASASKGRETKEERGGGSEKRQKTELKAKPKGNSAEVKQIAALNTALAKQMKAAEKEKKPMPSALSGRSRRSSTMASSRATQQAEMVRQLVGNT